MKRWISVCFILFLIGCSDTENVVNNENSQQEMKEYIDKLETEIEELKVENGQLKMDNHKLQKEMDRLKD